MADALDSKSSTLTGVEVQVLSPVLLEAPRLATDTASSFLVATDPAGDKLGTRLR